jgi:hypothetical protein
MYWTQADPSYVFLPEALENLGPSSWQMLIGNVDTPGQDMKKGNAKEVTWPVGAMWKTRPVGQSRNGICPHRGSKTRSRQCG